MLLTNRTFFFIALLLAPVVLSSGQAVEEEEGEDQKELSTLENRTAATENSITVNSTNTNAVDLEEEDGYDEGPTEEPDVDHVTEEIPNDQELSPTRVKFKPTVTVTATRIGSTRYFTSDDLTKSDSSSPSSPSSFSPTSTILAVPYHATNTSETTTTRHENSTTTTPAPVVTVLPVRSGDNEEDYVREWDEVLDEDMDDDENSNKLEHLPEPQPLVSPVEEKPDEEDELAEALNHKKQTKPDLRRHKKRRRRLRGKSHGNFSTPTPITATNRNGYPATIERPNDQTHDYTGSRSNTPKPFLPRMRMTRRFRSTTTSTTTVNPTIVSAKTMPTISELAITEVPAPKFSLNNNPNKIQPILLKSPLISSFKKPEEPAENSDDYYMVTAEPQIEKSVPSPYTETAPRGPEAQALSATETPAGSSGGSSSSSSTTPHNNETGEWLHSDGSRHAGFSQGGFFPMDRHNWEQNYMQLQQHSFQTPSEEEQEEETPIITLEDLYRQAHENHSNNIIMTEQPPPRITVVEHHHMHPPKIIPHFDPDHLGNEEHAKQFQNDGPSASQHHEAQFHPSQVEEPQIYMMQKDHEEEERNEGLNPYQSGSPDFKWGHPLLPPAGSHYDKNKDGRLQLEISKAVPDDPPEKPLVIAEIEAPPTDGVITDIQFYKEDDAVIPPLSKPVLTSAPLSNSLPAEYYQPKSLTFSSIASQSPEQPEVHYVDMSALKEANDIKYKGGGSGEKAGFMIPNHFNTIHHHDHESAVSPSHSPPSPSSSHAESLYHFSAGDGRSSPPSSPPQPPPSSPPPATSGGGRSKETDSSVIEIHHHHFPDGTSYAIRQPATKTASEEAVREDAEIIMGTHWGLSNQHLGGPSSRSGLPQAQGTRTSKNLFKPSHPAPPSSSHLDHHHHHHHHHPHLVPIAGPPPGFSHLKSSRYRDHLLHASPSLTLPMPGLVNIPTPPSEDHAMKEVTPHLHFPPYSHSMQHQSDYEPANPPLPTAHIYDQHFEHFIPTGAGHVTDHVASPPNSGNGGGEKHNAFTQTFTDAPYGTRKGPRKKKNKEKASASSSSSSQASTTPSPPPAVQESPLSDYFQPTHPHKEFMIASPPDLSSFSHPSHAEYHHGNNEIIFADLHNFDSLPTMPPIDHPNYTKNKPYRPDSNYNMENQGPQVHEMGGHKHHHHHHHEENNNAGGGQNEGKEQSPPQQTTNNIQDLLKQLANTVDGTKGGDEDGDVSPYSDTPYILMFHPTLKAKPTPAPVVPPLPPIALPFTSKDKQPAASSMGISTPSSEVALGPGMKVVPVHPRQQMLKVLATKQHLKKMEKIREQQNKPPAAIFTPYGVLVPIAASADAVNQAGSSPPKLTAFLNAHHEAIQHLKGGDKTKASASTTDEKSLLRALLGSKTHSEVLRKAKGTKEGAKTLETLLDTLAEKLALKLTTTNNNGQLSHKHDERQSSSSHSKENNKQQSYMNEGSYSELRPVVVRFNSTSSSRSTEYFGNNLKNKTRGGGSGETGAFGAPRIAAGTTKAPGPSPKRKEESGKVLPALPSQYFKSLLKERLVEMLEEKTQESSSSSGMMGTFGKGFSQLKPATATISSPGSHPFAPRRREPKFPRPDKTARKGGSGGTVLTASASKPVPSIVAPSSSSSSSSASIHSKRQGTDHQSDREKNHRPRFLHPSNGGILGAIKRLFSFGRQDTPAHRKQSNVTTLDSSRMRKRTGDFVSEEKKSITMSKMVTTTTTTSAATTATTPAAPIKNYNNNEDERMQSPGEGSPLHLKYGFKSAGEFERTLNELLKAKRSERLLQQHHHQQQPMQQGISSEKFYPRTLSPEQYNSYYKSRGSLPVMGLDGRVKLVPDHAFLSSYYNKQSPSVSWAKSMPINVIPSAASATSNYLPGARVGGTSLPSSPSSSSSTTTIARKNTDVLFSSGKGGGKKAIPLISTWKPIPDNSPSSSNMFSVFVSPPSAGNNSKATNNNTVSHYQGFQTAVAAATTTTKPVTAKLPVSQSEQQHLIRPRSIRA